MRPLKLLTAISVMTAVLAAPGAQAAEPAANTHLDESLRCFGAMSLMGSMDNPQAKTLGQMGGLYFMGRLDGAISDKDLEERLFAFSQNVANEDLPKLLTRCGDIMKVRGTAVQEIGNRVAAREAAAAKQ